MYQSLQSAPRIKILIIAESAAIKNLSPKGISPATKAPSSISPAVASAQIIGYCIKVAMMAPIADSTDIDRDICPHPPHAH